MRKEEICKAREKQIEDVSYMIQDIMKKIEVERSNIKNNEMVKNELAAVVNERNIELNEIRKEKEILFSKLQIVQKDVSRMRQNSGTGGKSFMAKMSSLFSFGGGSGTVQVSGPDNEFIQTSKGMVKKEEGKEKKIDDIGGTEAEVTEGTQEMGSPEFRDRTDSTNSNKSDEDEDITEEELLQRIRMKLDEDSN